MAGQQLNGLRRIQQHAQALVAEAEGDVHRTLPAEVPHEPDVHQRRVLDGMLRLHAGMSFGTENAATTQSQGAGRDPSGSDPANSMHSLDNTVVHKPEKRFRPRMQIEITGSRTQPVKVLIVMVSELRSCSHVMRLRSRVQEWRWVDERTKDCSMHLTMDVLPRAAAMCSGVEFGFHRAGTVKSARRTP